MFASKLHDAMPGGLRGMSELRHEACSCPWEGERGVLIPAFAGL
jgi:hypothetical protein